MSDKTRKMLQFFSSRKKETSYVNTVKAAGNDVCCSHTTRMHNIGVHTHTHALTNTSGLVRQQGKTFRSREAEVLLAANRPTTGAVLLACCRTTHSHVR